MPQTLPPGGPTPSDGWGTPPTRRDSTGGGPGGPSRGGTTATITVTGQQKRVIALVAAVLAAVVVAALAFVVVRKVTEEKPTGPLGWSDEETMSHFIGAGFLQDCNFGDDAYATMGIHDVEVSKDGETCEGYVRSGDDGPEAAVKIKVSGKDYRYDSDDSSPQDPDLSTWRKRSSGRSLGRSSSIKTCQYWGATGNLAPTYVETTGPCDAIDPAARFLQDLTAQRDWIAAANRAKQGGGEFTVERPRNLRITPPTFRLEDDRWQEHLTDAKDQPSKETVDFMESRDSTFDLTEMSATRTEDGTKLCFAATFTLGEGVRDNDWDLPELFIALPGASSYEVGPDWDIVGDTTVRPGLTAQGRNCTTISALRNVDVAVAIGGLTRDHNSDSYGPSDPDRWIWKTRI
ncbi:hypothetical protein QDW14_03630 [Corynebacterium bovis]|uniref:hypothetical protein n=1 Tax=Corynebacterium bovis TaxID=36808 RepID=UPI00244AB152|nr:hypothetical protein [Corynebacterium bovis]MDH2455569.1 hypothetical protein [Corynebacterium bovis]